MLTVKFREGIPDLLGVAFAFGRAFEMFGYFQCTSFNGLFGRAAVLFTGRIAESGDPYLVRGCRATLAMAGLPYH